jgi:pimeloyl-ACP methyl ester carboxylesterase
MQRIAVVLAVAVVGFVGVAWAFQRSVIYFLPVVDHVNSYEGPVLVIWGEGDTIVPPDQSAAVAEAAPRSRHVVIAGADHNDRALLDGVEFVEAVVGFLAEHT